MALSKEEVIDIANKNGIVLLKAKDIKRMAKEMTKEDEKKFKKFSEVCFQLKNPEGEVIDMKSVKVEKDHWNFFIGLCMVERYMDYEVNSLVGVIKLANHMRKEIKAEKKG
jgi:Cu2+-containing amine oxidase